MEAGRGHERRVGRHRVFFLLPLDIKTPTSEDPNHAPRIRYSVMADQGAHCSDARDAGAGGARGRPDAGVVSVGAVSPQDHP